MSFIFASLRHWILWLLLAFNASVFAALISNSDSTALQSGKESNGSLQIAEFDPSPEIQRHFELAGLEPGHAKPFDNQLHTEEFSYYNFEVPDANIMLGIRVENDEPLRALDFERLLRRAVIRFTGRITQYGGDTPLSVTQGYVDHYPSTPGPATNIDIQNHDSPLGQLTLGVVLHSLRGILAFRRAHPEKNGALVVLIHFPPFIPPYPEDWTNGVGHITVFKSVDPP